jgi:Phage integrase family
LAKAQVALAVALLIYMPLRGQNLSALTFDTHLFLRDGVRATSSLEFNADEVKNGMELAYDIPSHVAKLLIEYRIARKIIGRRPEQLFVNADGTAKHPKVIADLITRYLKSRAGIVVTPHQFRHLSAKLILDAAPGSFETVRQLLGHKNLKTTVTAYAGIDSRRAARHHQMLIEQMLAGQTPPPERLVAFSVAPAPNGQAARPYRRGDRMNAVRRMSLMGHSRRRRPTPPVLGFRSSPKADIHSSPWPPTRWCHKRPWRYLEPTTEM